MNLQKVNLKSKSKA